MHARTVWAVSSGGGSMRPGVKTGRRGGPVQGARPSTSKLTEWKVKLSPGVEVCERGEPKEGRALGVKETGRLS